MAETVPVAPVASAAPDTRLELWKGLRLGMSKEEMRAVMPISNSLGDLWTKDNARITDTCSASVSLTLPSWEKKRGLQSVVMFGDCPDAALVALTAKYGEPQTGGALVAGYQVGSGQVAATGNKQTYRWTANGVLIELFTIDDGHKRFKITYAPLGDTSKSDL